MTDKLYSQAELDALLKAAEAAALREAAERIRINREARGEYSSSWEQGYLDGQKWSINEILGISPAASLALERLIAKARLEEAEWWAENRMHMILPYVPEKVGPRGANRLAELRRAAVKEPANAKEE